MPHITTGKPALWLRLKHYHFEHLVPAHLTDHVMAVFGGPDAATRAFASKLTRKLGWTSLFALRAIAEYRKFLYLGMVSEVPVTPSKVIDQVWHEHLLFTRGYDEFCREVLGRPFDHHPELVPMDDQTEVFHEQYEATLDLYEAEFNTAPPPDIWATPKFKPGLARIRRALRRKDGGADAGTASADGDVPLHVYFDGGSRGGTAPDGAPEFGGGGGFGGAGGEASWADSFVASFHGGDSDSSSVHGSAGDSGPSEAGGAGSDGSASDGGSSDGGGSDGGGSGCSSGCGGGGCGGGE